MKKIIITGASGMIGANIVKKALDQGCTVLCIIRHGSSKEKNLPVHPKLNILYSDISGYSTIQAEGVYDTFFHLAWEKTYGNARDDTETQLRNIQYTLDAVHLAKRFGCTAFIGAGSQAEYGPVESPLKGDTPVNPLSGYGIAKYTAGKMSKLLCSQLGMRFNWVRVLSVYGSLDNPYTLIMYTLKELKQDRLPTFTKCEQVWDYLNEKDAASAFLSIGTSGVDGKVYPLGSGKGSKLREYLEIIQKKINPLITLEFGQKDYFPNQPMYLVADISEIENDTGWRPQIKFEDGISEMLSTVVFE